LQDSVLIALGRAVFVPIENAVFSLLKLALLAALVTLAPIYGIFVSWTIAMLVSVVGVNLLIFLRLMRPAAARAPAVVANIRDRAFAGYFAADYACSIAWLSTTNLMPVIITAAAGAATNAYWALAYAVALPLYAFAQNIGTSLILHGTNDRAALPSLTRKAAVQGARVLIPSVTLLVILAPYLLALFGPNYADKSATLLRLLALGALPNFVLSLAVSVARVQRRLRRAVFALVTEAALTLGLATPLLHAWGIGGVGVLWVGSQCIVAAGLLLTWRSALEAGPDRPASKPSARAASLGRATEGARPHPQTAGSNPGGDDLHPILRALFQSLETRAVRWTLLRVPSNSAAPSGDVDLLVHEADATALRELAEEAGFVALPGWRSAPDLILMAYDRQSDQWLILDVSTAVSFRSPSSWQLPEAADHVLRRRQRSGSMVVPTGSDTFWLVLLHCLLDKGFVATNRRSELQRLAADASESPLGVTVCVAAGPAFARSVFIEAVRAGAWDDLARMGRRLAAALRWRRTTGERLAALATGTVHLVRKPLLIRRRRGISVALLGPNGVGKSTAASGLQRTLPFQTMIVYMGLWKVTTASRGRIRTVAEILARPIWIWSRYLLAQYHQLRGRVVIFDRYVYEALLPARPPLLFAKRPYFWLLAHAVPAAEVAIVLDVPGSVAYGRKQENPPDELESERQIYGRLSDRVPSLTTVDASADADTVRAEITEIVWRRLAERWQGRS
ncbi:MAG: hypothetical protein ACXVQR_07030, partial [Solirubrobacteraceae bacterium]